MSNLVKKLVELTNKNPMDIEDTLRDERGKLSIGRSSQVCHCCIKSIKGEPYLRMPRVVRGQFGWRGCNLCTKCMIHFTKLLKRFVKSKAYTRTRFTEGL